MSRHPATPALCIASGCDRLAFRRFLCGSHYQYARRRGLELPPKLTMGERVSARLEPSAIHSYNGSPCLEWTGARTRHGYGKIGVNGRSWVPTHRAAYESHHGVTLPSSLFVCHHCDNPPCCNLAHLFVGTNNDNMADMAAKGRSARGVRNGMSNLSEAEVRLIRCALADGLPTCQVAKQFGRSASAIDHIKYGRRWAWLP